MHYLKDVGTIISTRPIKKAAISAPRMVTEKPATMYCVAYRTTAETKNPTIPLP